MSKSKREVQDELNKNQLIKSVEYLINAINSESDFNIAIVEGTTPYPWFEISVEYPPYEGLPKFQRRVSALMAQEIAANIYHNIKDEVGLNHEASFKLFDADGETIQYGDGRIHREQIDANRNDNRIRLYKKIHIEICLNYNC